MGGGTFFAPHTISSTVYSNYRCVRPKRNSHSCVHRDPARESKHQLHGLWALFGCRGLGEVYQGRTSGKFPSLTAFRPPAVSRTEPVDGRHARGFATIDANRLVVRNAPPECRATHGRLAAWQSILLAPSHTFSNNARPSERLPREHVLRAPVTGGAGRSQGRNPLCAVSGLGWARKQVRQARFGWE